MRLPPPIAEYMAACARLEADAILAPFATEATVRDEGQTYRGRDAIQEWIADTTLKYQAVPKPLSHAEDAGLHLVTADVSDALPGSPVTLAFRFTLAGDAITRLEIG